jgi:hypothetical protein
MLSYLECADIRLFSSRGVEFATVHIITINRQQVHYKREKYGASLVAVDGSHG